MSRLILLCYFIVLYVTDSLGTFWEFGQNYRNSIVVSNNEGEISRDQKTKRVTFTVPACYEPVYVRVEVRNEFTTPSVSYMDDTNTVVISYRAKQRSSSEYNVIAKAVEREICGQRKRDRKKSNKRSKQLKRQMDLLDIDRQKSKKHEKHRKHTLRGYKVSP